MATGDQNDMVARLRAALPSQWFPTTAAGAPSATPVLDGLLHGLAAAWAWLYGLIAYANLQARISTATDVWLDLISLDFFGHRFPRRAGEPDISFATRIKQEVIRPRATRAALTQALVDLTGHAPAIFEPANASDTGGYGSLGMTRGTGLGFGPSEVLDARGTVGTYFDNTLTLQTAQPYVPRYDYSSGSMVLLNEPASLNGIRNPRAEGATPGTPGTMPTFWTSSANNGLSLQVVGSGYANGLPYLDIRFFGTATAAAACSIVPEGVGVIPASPGQVWTTSAFMLLVGGTLQNVASPHWTVEEWSGTPTLLGSQQLPQIIPTSGMLAQQRLSGMHTVSNAATAYVRSYFRFSVAAGSSIDVTLRFAAPQLEQQPAATSVILPVIGLPGQTARAADNLASVGGGGGFGSLALPFQCFVTAYRASGGGIASVGGFYLGSGWGGGGYGSGALQFGALDMSVGQITDTAILGAITATLPEATIAWTALTNHS